MVVTLSGTKRAVKLQSMKALWGIFDIDVKLKLSTDNDLHPLKHSTHSSETVAGIVTDVRFSQPKNAFGEIIFILGNIRTENFEFWKQDCVILSNFVHMLKLSSGMLALVIISFDIFLSDDGN